MSHLNCLHVGYVWYVYIKRSINQSIKRSGRHLHYVWLKNTWQLEHGQKLLNIVSINCKKMLCGRGSAPDPAEGAYSAPPDPVAGGEGAGCPFPRTPPPHWLKIPERVRFRLCVLTYRCLNSTAPHYLAETIRPVSSHGTRHTPPISRDVNLIGTMHASFDSRWSVILSGCRTGMERSTLYRNTFGTRRKLKTVLFRSSFPLLYLRARRSVLICHHVLAATNWFCWYCPAAAVRLCHLGASGNDDVNE